MHEWLRLAVVQVNYWDLVLKIEFFYFEMQIKTENIMLELKSFLH